MLDTPRITQTSPRITASIHMTIPRAEMPKVFGPGVGELMAALAAQGVDPAGPVFTHHLKMSPDIFDFELSVPVSRPVVAAGRVYIGSGDGRLYVLDAQTGKKLSEFDAGAGISTSPAVAGGRVVIGTQDGRLYVLG